MKIFTLFSLKSILAVFLSSLLIFSLLVMAVETFMHLDSFMTGTLGLKEMGIYAFTSLSEYFVMLSGISILFAITYFLSNLSANNELISLYNAGLSKVRILKPVIFLSMIMTIFFFYFNESIALNWKSLNARISQEYFGLSSTQDAANTVLYDENSGFLVYAERYSESYQRLYSPILIKRDGSRVLERIEADHADYDGSLWRLRNARVVKVDEDGSLTSFTDALYTDESFTLPSEFFRSQNLQIETMELWHAYNYLSRLKSVNPVSWQEGMTDFLSRLAEPFGILVLSVIAMSMNYSYKKNILLFSIVQSLLIAVVYYVADMVFSIAARQGTISVYFLLYAPSVITVLLSYVIAYLGKKI